MHIIIIKLLKSQNHLKLFEVISIVAAYAATIPITSNNDM